MPREAEKLLHVTPAAVKKEKNYAAKTGTTGALWPTGSPVTHSSFLVLTRRRNWLLFPTPRSSTNSLRAGGRRLSMCGPWGLSAHHNNPSSSRYLGTNWKTSQTKPSSIIFIWCYNRCAAAVALGTAFYCLWFFFLKSKQFFCSDNSMCFFIYTLWPLHSACPVNTRNICQGNTLFYLCYN